MLTNPRNAFRGQSRSPNMVPFHNTYGFLLVCYSKFVRETHWFWDILLQKCRDFENRTRGPSRTFNIFNVENYRDLEIPVKGHSRSFKLIPLDRFIGFGFLFYRNFVLLRHNKDLISGFWVIQLTDKQTDIGENITSLAEVTIWCFSQNCTCSYFAC